MIDQIVSMKAAENIYNYLALFPCPGRNSLEPSMSSNYYLCYQKVGSTNHISECCHMSIVKPNCVVH